MEGLALRKGAWTKEEDELLKQFIEIHGEGKWHRVPIRAGLNRCRKSCRMRWLNYLKPNIKRGEFAEDEVDLIIRLHKLLGNRWSLIAGRLPGRTANDVKNYWNTHQRKKNNQKMVSYAKISNDKSQEDTNSPVVVIRPRPRTFSKRFHCSGRCTNLEHNHSEVNYANGKECANLEHNHSEENYTNGREVLAAEPPQTLDSENVIDWWEQLSEDSTNSIDRTMCSALGLEDDFFTDFWVDEDMVQLASIDDHDLGKIYV